MKLLIAMPVCANDGPLAERALEFIYRLNAKRQVGHILLVANADLHAEMRQKIKVTADMAFESVTETVAVALPKDLANHKIKQMNNLFRHAAQTAQNSFRWPWLWLEPDCTPLKSDWIAQLAQAYDTQPRKYMGMVSKNANDKLIMARCGVYYPGASYELDKLCQGESPFATACAEKIVESASNSSLVDYLPLEWEDDIAKISPRAVICHGDKQGLVAENWSDPEAVRNEINAQIDADTLERYSKLSFEEMANTKIPPHLWQRAREIEMEKFKNTLSLEQRGKAAEIASGNVTIKNGDLPPGNNPRLSRRQKRELVNNGTKV